MAKFTRDTIETFRRVLASQLSDELQEIVQEGEYNLTAEFWEEIAEYQKLDIYLLELRDKDVN